MQAIFLVLCLSLAVLSSCAGSVVAINSDTPQELMAENTNNLCMALGGLPANERIVAELIRRGAARPQFISLARKRSVALGMNTCEVKAALSEGIYVPRVNRTIVQGMVQEQWDYSSDESRMYVYFTNGLVTAIQN